ncbi:MAG: hypothetical protein JNL21_35925 [Myxococcales bacterium]|nr:hypothetical protein [Myxococcales bacterium]
MKRSLILFFFALAALFTGCAPKWTVIQQASPNPFVGKTGDFQVLPIDYSELKVGEKSEEQYLAEKDEKQQASFKGDKQAVDERFQAELKDTAQGEGISVGAAAGQNKGFLIKPKVEFFEPGYYAVVASAPSEIRMRISIEGPDGKVLDIIEVRHQTDSKSSGFSIGGISTNPSSGGRLREDAEWIGEAVAEYIISRVKPE